MRDIVNTAIEAGSFKMLVSAIQAAELVDTLRGIGPFTVFAPDDEAFAKLPSGTFDSLLKDMPKLKAILMYHVVLGKLTVDEIGQMNTAKTLQGQEVKIDAHKWHLHMNPKINDANITSKDIGADNGMIHVLNRVLMPNMELTCQVDGMGFMTMDALNAHTKMGHVTAKAPEPIAASKIMPAAEKAPESMPAVDDVPVVEKMPEPMPPSDVMPVAEKPLEPMPAPETMPAVEKAPEPMTTADVIPQVENTPEPMLTAEEIWEPLAATAKEAVAVFEILCDSAGKYRFHLKATNGQIIAVSQSYGTKESAMKGISSIKKNALIAKIADFTEAEEAKPESTHKAGIVQDPIFEIQCNAVDKFRFHLKAVNGQIIVVSQSYLTRQSAEKGIASVKKNAPMAKVVDQTVTAT